MKSFNSKNQKGLIKSTINSAFCILHSAFKPLRSLLLLAVALMVSGNVWGVTLFSDTQDHTVKTASSNKTLYEYTFSGQPPITQISFYVSRTTANPDPKIKVQYKTATTGYVDYQTDIATESGGKIHTIAISGAAQNATGFKIIIQSSTTFNKTWKINSFYLYTNFYARAESHVVPSSGVGGGAYISINDGWPSQESQYIINDYSNKTYANQKSSPTANANYEAKAKTGYSLKGWYANSAGTGAVASTALKYTESYTVDSYTSGSPTNLVRYPIFIPNDYTITFDKNGGVANGGATATYNSNTLKSITHCSRNGYTLAGYYTAAKDGSMVVNSSGQLQASVSGYTDENKNWVKAENTTLYAHWTANKYTVSFDQQSGTGGSSSVSATYDSAMPSATMPTRTGYTFGGYYDGTNGSGTQYYTEKGASARTWNKAQATTLYAKWTIINYNISYANADGWTHSNPSTYTVEDAITFSVATKTGYTFNGWSPASIAKGSTGNTTVTASWTAHSYSVAFNGNGNTGGSMSTQTGFEYGTGKTLTKNNYTRTGYSFAGWKLNNTGDIITDEASVSTLTAEDGGTATLYAQWTANPYSVTLNGNESSSVGSATATYDSNKLTNLSAPTLSNYSVVGYFTQADENGIMVADASGNLQANVSGYTGANGKWTRTSGATLYTHWHGQFYVSIDAYTVGDIGGSVACSNGGTWDPSSTTHWNTPHYHDYEKPMTNQPSVSDAYPTATARYYAKAFTGYSFKGWFVNASDQTPEAMGDDAGFHKYTVDYLAKSMSQSSPTNMTRYAKFEANTYNITFNYNDGGSTPTEVKQVTFATTYGTAIPTISDPAFLGWFTDEVEGHQVTADSAVIASDRTLYAHWFTKSCNVTFDACGGSACDQQEVKVGSPYGELPTSSRTGYDFNGWWTAAKGGTQITAGSTVIEEEDHTLYAHWKSLFYFQVNAYSDPESSYYNTHTTGGYTTDCDGGTWIFSNKDGDPSGFLAHDWITRTYGDGTEGGQTIKVEEHPIAKMYFHSNSRIKDGYAWEGWYTEPNGQGTLKSSEHVYYEEFEVTSIDPDNISMFNRYAYYAPVTVSPADAQTVSVTNSGETETTLTFAVENADADADFNEPTVSGDAGWTVKSWEYADNQVSVVMKFTATAGNTQHGARVATVTLKAKSDNYATGTVTANVSIAPTFTCNVKTTYKVGDVLDLNALWTSNNTDGTKKYTVVDFSEDQGVHGTTPAVSGSSLTMTSAGTLKIKLEQAVGTYYSGKTATTETITVTRIDNTISVAATKSLFVGESWESTVTTNSDATVTANIADQTLIAYDAAKNKLTAQNTTPQSFDSKDVQVIFSQAQTFKYTAANCTTVVTVNKRAPEITGQESYTLSVGGTQTANYSSQYTTTEKPSADSNADFYYTIEVVSIDAMQDPDHSDQVVSYNPSTKVITAHNAGTATITFRQKQTYNYKAANKSFTVVVNKHTPTFTWGSATLSTNQKIEDYFSTNNTDSNCPITYSSSGMVTLFAGSTDYKLSVQAEDSEGSASLTVTQAENYYWIEHSETQPVTVTKPSNHLEMNMTSQTAWDNYMTASMATSWSDDEIEFEYNGSSSKNRYVEFTFTGIPDKMTFSTSSDAGLQTPTWTWYQKIGSADWTQIEAKKQKNISVSATLSPDARAVKISYTGVLNAGYIADLKVTELKYLRRQNNETTTLNFGSHQQGDVPAAQSFVVEHANAGYKTTITAPDHYQISLSENGTYTKTINYSSKSDAKTGGDKMGTITVWVKYLADEEGEHNNVSVVVHTDNGLADVTIPVTGKTVGKLKTTIVWNGKEDRQYSDSDGEVSNPFIVKDENNQVIDGAVVTYTTSNSDITSVNSSTYKFTPYCGGDVVLTASYAGDETTYSAATDHPETIHVALCEPTISWDQTFLSYTTADKGQEETLSAKVKNVDGNEMSSVSYTYSTANTAVASVKDNSKLVINDKGETNLTFEITANATDAKGRQYNTAHASRTVRVRGEGEACNSTVLSKGSLTYHTDQSDKFPLSGPVNKISFKYSRNTYVLSGGTKLTINLLDANSATLKQIFQKDYSDMGTSEASFNELDISSYTTAKYLEIQCTNGRYESNEIYLNDLSISQKTYFTADKSSISANVAVNTPYSTTIKLDYSDVPVVQYSITNNSGMGFTLTPDRTPDNDCGAVGSYTFTLSGTCIREIPASPVTQETITLFTSAGNSITIPFTITATPGQALTFNNNAGAGDKNWETLTNWTTGTEHPGTLPNASNAVTINREMVINSKVECYSLSLVDNAAITIMPTGGLTVHAGGVTGLNSDNFRIKSTTESQGYFRMSPEATTAMPNATVEYATKSDVGAGNKDAKWQYFGVPTADNYSFYVDYITWVCKWDETTVGWIPLPQLDSSALEPFHGYIITGYDNQIRDFAGQLYNGDKEIVLTHTANGMKGDNVIANSYAAPIDVSKFKDTDFDGGELFEHVFYLMESGSYNNWQNNIKNKSITAADVSKPSPGQYIALPAPGAGDLGSVTTIAPMQGVYMYNGGQGNATLKLNYKKHVWSATGNLNRPMNAPERDIASVDPDTLRQRVRLSLVNTESGADILYLIEREKYTSEYDNGYDANKIIVDNMVNIYTNEQAGNMAVSAINDIDSMYVGFTNGAGDTLTMYASLIVGEPMYLLDTHTETRTLLTEGATYTFTAEPNTRDDFRFMLLKQSHSGDDPIYTGWINKDAAPDAHIWNTRDMLYVTEAGAHSHLYLYSMNGQLIDSQSFSDHTSMSIVSLPKGCYMARVGRTIYKFVR